MTPLAIPAASLVVFRDRHGAPELLMVERSEAMVFAGGALVFPGGRIDPGDDALATDMALGGDTPARIAAIRETIEEAGLAIGLSPPPAAPVRYALRARLHAGGAFATLLADAGLALDLTRLHPFARWRPAGAHARIFDTLFFLARAPADIVATVDGTENVRLLWTTAANLLDQADRGAATLLYPTRRILERLALFASFDDAVRHARRYPIRTITPFIERRGGEDHLCIPDDLGYPVTSEALVGANRG